MSTFGLQTSNGGNMPQCRQKPHMILARCRLLFHTRVWRLERDESRGITRKW
jgi:hypothetical protein